MNQNERIGELKLIHQDENGSLWTTVTVQEYMNFDRDPNYVPPKISKFKKWRTKTAKSFWYKLHSVAEDHGACDNYCC